MSSLTGVCANYQSSEDFHIGYIKNSKLFFIISSSIGMLVNLFIIVDFFLRGRKTEIRKKALIEQMFCLLSIVDGLMSIYWLLSSTLFSTSKDIQSRCNGCFAMSLFTIFLSTFDLTYLNIIIYHLQIVNANPIDGILNPMKKMICYFLISIGIAFTSVLCAFIENVYGISPMLTCYIKGRYRNTDVKNRVLVSIFNLIPIVLIVYGIYQLLKVYKSKILDNSQEMRKVFKRNTIYILVYFGLNTPLVFLYVLTVFVDVTESKPMRIVSFIISITSSLIPLIVSCLRVYQGIVKIDWIQNLKKGSQNKKDEEDKYTALVTKNTYNQIEDKSINDFMKNIYAGIAYSIKESIKYKDCVSAKIEDCINQEVFKISLNTFGIEDDLVKESGYLDVEINVYGPKAFALLRKLDQIDDNEMYQSFLPMRNRAGISKSQGKSGTFFISTDDNQFMIKTLKDEEFELIKSTFLKRYVDYIRKTPESLICRIYGMYKIIMSNGNEKLIILMRNVIGNLKNCILCKFDLKGSTAGRREKINEDNVDKIVMKDLNFEEIEKGIIISKDNGNKVRNISKQDAYFFEQMELMDYSLFVVKLSMSKELNNIIANKEVNGNGSNAYSDIQCLRKHLYPSLNVGVWYIISIIDYLQTYNFLKYMETGYKSVLAFKMNNKDISCVEPSVYAKRFTEYIEKITDVESIVNSNQEIDLSLSQSQQSNSEEEKIIQ